MTELNQVYRCTICGNVIEVVNAGGGELYCCGKPMQLMAENSVDAAKEKHVPVIEKVEGGYKVGVGSVEHPMQPEHYIQWIELMAGDKVIRHRLAPGEKPEAVFVVDADKVKAREYCNLHGLWVAE